MVLKFRDNTQTGFTEIEAAGEFRALACLPSPKDHDLPAYTARVKVLPREELKDVDYSRYVRRILNQAKTNACVGYSTCGAAETTRSISGAAPINLSAPRIYSMINGNRDQGANILDAMLALKNKGTCTEEKGPYGKIYDRQYSDSEKAEGQRFRIYDAEALYKFDEFCTAAQFGEVFVFGIDVYDNFDTDADGCIPDPRGRKRGGHALYGIGCAMKKGRLHIHGVNSWSVNWGKQGHFWIPESYFQNSDGFVIRSMREDPNETNSILKNSVSNVA